MSYHTLMYLGSLCRISCDVKALDFYVVRRANRLKKEFYKRLIFKHKSN